MKRWHVAAAAVALAIAALLWLVRSREGAPARTAAAGGDAAPGATAAGQAATPGARSPVPQLPAPVGEVPAVPSRYGPTSRPLSDGDIAALVHPTAGEEATGRVGDPRSAAGEELTWTLRVDRHAATGDQAVTITLAVYRGTPARGVRVPVVIEAASLRVVEASGGRDTEVAPLSFNDVGRDGDDAESDDVYTARAVPAALRLAAGQYRAAVRFRAGEEASTEARAAFRYTPERDVPGRFTGRIEDRVDSGALVIAAEVDVRTAGTFTIAANLEDAGGRPLARATGARKLERGKAMIELRYQGLIFHDKGTRGPYTVKYLHGFRATEQPYPNHREAMPDWEGTHVTAAYEVKGFSSATWDGKTR